MTMGLSSPRVFLEFSFIVRIALFGDHDRHYISGQKAYDTEY